MWVYQQTGTPAHLPEAAQPLPTGEAALLPQPQKTLPPERSAPEVPSPLQRHHTETRQKTYWLLVCAFLIGSGSAGVLLAFCEKQQPDWLQYYLQSWRGLFAAADAHTAASLFGMEYLTLAAAAQAPALLRIVRTVLVGVVGLLAHDNAVLHKHLVQAATTAVVPAGRRLPLA